MKQIKIKIMYHDFTAGEIEVDQHSFELTLYKTSWFKLDGNWTCLPGYLKKITGYFSLLTVNKSSLFFWDRDSTFSEDFSKEKKQKLYMALDEFPEAPKAGMKGKGQAFEFGARVESQMLSEKKFNRSGYASSLIKWQITEVL